jgi:hypothetical protein
MTMHRLTFLLTSILLGTAATAQEPLLDSELLEDAEPEIRRYTVEVIVFAYAEDVSIGTEVFLPDVIEVVEPDPFAIRDPGVEGSLPDDSVPASVLANTGDSDDADEEKETRFEMVLLTDEELTMTDTLDRLDLLDAYEPLLHIGWTQTALPEDETPTLDLREFGEPPEGLTGGLTLYLSRYLHLVVDLELAAPVTGETITAGPELDGSAFYEPIARYGDARRQDEGYGYFFDPEPVYAPLHYRINENRLFRNGEIRYYDHPKFGVIAKILRYEVEEEEDIPDDTEFLSPAVASE